MSTEFTYGLVYKSQFDEARERGYQKGTVSTDGNWTLICKADQDMFTWIEFDDELLAEYMKVLGINKCCLNWQLARALVETKATIKGASNGYLFPEAL